MVISTEHKCIFIHVNKTGGRSISTSLFQRIKPHLTVKELFELEPNNEIYPNERLQIAQYDPENIFGFLAVTLGKIPSEDWHTLEPIKVLFT